jgi:CysZ protein
MEFFQGMKLVLSVPRLWPYCWKPLLAALAVYVTLGVGVWLLVMPLLIRWLQWGSGAEWLVGILVSVLILALWILLFSYVFVLLSSLFSSFLWDRLAEQVEIVDGGGASAVSLSRSALIMDALARFALALFVGILAFGCAFVIGPFAPLLAAALLGLLDFTAPANLRRGRTLGAQWSRVFRRKSLGFALTAGLLSLLPIVNVLLLPGLVAGGTLLMRTLEAEESSARR